MAELSIVLPTCNRATLLADAIAHVRRNTRSDYELIVVDGASTDDTAAVLEQAEYHLGPRLRVIRETQRGGFTKAVNLGFRVARGRYMTWLNDDARPVNDSLDRAVAQLANAPKDVGLLAMFHYCKADRSVAYRTVRQGVEFKLMHVRGTLYATFAIGRREVYEQSGHFDEQFIVRGADSDLSLKVWNAGLRVVPAFDALIDHDEIDDDRRAKDNAVAQADNDRLFAKWDLPQANPVTNEFDPTHPCTLRGLRGGVANAA